MVRLKKQLISDTPYEYGTANKKVYITVHETGNTNVGANAQVHANLQSNGNSRNAAWHYQVDDKEAYQSFTHNHQLWQSGDGRGDGNLNSISIEICVNEDGDFQNTLKNAAKLVKNIMDTEDISISYVVQHNHWSGKNCPQTIREKIGWNNFLGMINGEGIDVDVDVDVDADNKYPSSAWKEVTGNWNGQTLGKGEYGKPVQQLQNKLANNKPPFYPNKGADNNGVDSYYGVNTKNVVSRYQSYYGLSIDGLAGIEVYNSLKESNDESGKYGELKIVNVNNAAIVMDKPDRDNANNLGTIGKGRTVPLNGSVTGRNNSGGYWEVEYDGSLGYITAKYGERV